MKKIAYNNDKSKKKYKSGGSTMISIFRASAVIALPFFLYLLAIKPNTSRREKMKPFREVYVAHRGLFDNKREAPENSMAAFKKAVSYGYGIELDVQMTKDGKLVVFHDDTLERMCKEKKKVVECTYLQLQQYTLGISKEKIPLFDEVLDMVAGRVPLIIEIKPEGNYIETTRRVVERLRRYKGIYCIESFHPMVIAWCRRHAPQILRGQLATSCTKERIKRNVCEKIVLTNLLLNFLAKPDFIAYNHKYADAFSYRLCRTLYSVENVAWTIKSQGDLEKAKKIFQVFIFDSFIPK
ncbi:MAG: glycerophosphodiester phosphodiesterase family protein [Lachnospiraceae bacterium]|nr:glycerophosphodiester phosphodiesterase family protein [Lachnospiraceae bacterium]